MVGGEAVCGAEAEHFSEAIFASTERDLRRREIDHWRLDTMGSGEVEPPLECCRAPFCEQPIEGPFNEMVDVRVISPPFDEEERVVPVVTAEQEVLQARNDYGECFGSMLPDSRLEKVSKERMEHVAAVALGAEYTESNGVLEHSSAGLVTKEQVG